MQQREVVVAGGARTPMGNFGGGLRGSNAVALGGIAVAGAFKRAGVSPDLVDSAYVGHARQAGNGPNPGRLMAVAGGSPYSAPVTTIQMACLSGLQAAILAYKDIALGQSRTVLVAGSEHMSSIPYLSPNTRWGARTGDAQLLDALYKDGFLDPMTGKVMGQICDTYETRFGITREQQDEFALRSNLLAAKGWDEGFHQMAVVPVTLPGKKQDTVVDHDEHYRRDATMEALAKLRPAFGKDGTITAGNASALCDAAAAFVMLDAERAREVGAKPLARVLGVGVAAQEPEDFGIAPVQAVKRALDQAGLRQEDIDVWELNEAFAIQVLACLKLMDMGVEKVNPYGGAIALGHPIGCSGARIVQAAVDYLVKHNARYAVAATCGNGGQGAAMVLERL